MGIPAAYFDGKTSRKFEVELSVDGGIAVITGAIERRCGIDELRVSERVKNARRKVTFPDGAYLEVLDNAALHLLLTETGYQEPLVVRMQQSWRATLAACIATVAVVALGYLYGVPALSAAIATALPQKVERAIGAETLSFLDKQMMAPSQLPQAQRTNIVRRFKTMLPPQAGVPDYEIIFRKSKIGPNAFALPSGEIVLTDEIIALAGSDDAVMGILAHELGHLHERHLMRRIIAGSAIGAATAALFGDVSSILVGLPTIMLDMKYSRDAERDADRYAIAMMKANGISVLTLAHAFEKLDDKSEHPAPYLSSHPPTKERIEQIRSAQ